MGVEVSGNTGHTFSHQLQEALETHQQMLSDAEIAKAFEDSCAACLHAYRYQRKILIAENGGSAADAQHFAGELVSQFHFDRPALAAIALTTDTSILTAIGNDYGYEDVFSRQVQALGMTVICLTGRIGGTMKSFGDICFYAPSNLTPRVQECHLLIEHSLCAWIEEELFGRLRPK